MEIHSHEFIKGGAERFIILASRPTETASAACGVKVGNSNLDGHCASNIEY
jgi:hypothetical protein